MIKAKSFQEDRRDGKSILETMSVQDLFDKGWGVDQVIAIRWKSETGNIEVKNSDGILAEVLPDRSGVEGDKGSSIILTFSQIVIYSTLCLDQSESNKEQQRHKGVKT